MIHLEHTVEIDRPPAEVFDYMMDMENLPEWQSSAIEAHWEGERAAGSRIKEVRKFLGRRIESELEVTEYEPNRRFCLKTLSGPVLFSVEHTFEATTGGTRITFVGEGNPGGFFKLAEPMVARAAERQFKGDFATLKDLLEARGA
jgi:uncharacterized protein YndB with AHSA1/START domain